MFDRRTVLLALMLFPAACARPQPQPAGPQTTSQVRTDHAPLSRRFPALGAFTEAHWQGTAVGNEMIPGPADLRIQAVVALDATALARFKDAYQWEQVPAGWEQEVNEPLRAFLPPAPQWKTHPLFASAVHSSDHYGDVWLDVATGIIFLDVSTF